MIHIHACIRLACLRPRWRARRLPSMMHSDPHPPLFYSPSQLGTHGRGKKKREEMGNLLRKMSRKAPAADAK